MTIAEAMAVFQESGDHAGTAKAWRLLAWTHGTACHFALAAEAQANALEYARLAGDVRQQARAATAYGAAAVFGSTPVSEAIERCEHMVEQVTGDRHAEGILLALLGSLYAMQGSFDRARELSAQGRSMLDELGLGVEGVFIDIEAWRIEMLSGDPMAAERELRRAYDSLRAVGEKYVLSTVAGLLAETLYALDRIDEVERLSSLAEELATDDDVDTQALLRRVRAKILALEGSFDAAETYAREALEILAPTDAILLRFGALLDLAEVRRLAGRETDARAALDEALDLAELKGSPVMARAVQDVLAALRDRSVV